VQYNLIRVESTGIIKLQLACCSVMLMGITELAYWEQCFAFSISTKARPLAGFSAFCLVQCFDTVG